MLHLLVSLTQVREAKKLSHRRRHTRKDSPRSTERSRGCGLVGGASHGPDLCGCAPLAEGDELGVAGVAGAAEVAGCVEPPVAEFDEELSDDMSSTIKKKKLLLFRNLINYQAGTQDDLFTAPCLCLTTKDSRR